MHTLLFTATGERPSQPAAERKARGRRLVATHNPPPQQPPEEQVVTTVHCRRVVVIQVHPQAVLPLDRRPPPLLSAFVTQAGVGGIGGVVA